MASRTPSRSRAARPKRRAAKSSRRSPKKKASQTPRRRATRAAKSAEPSHPAEITPALREQFEKLGTRWKELLPRLTHSAGNNGHAPARATRTRARHAPAKRRAPRR